MRDVPSVLDPEHRPRGAVTAAVEHHRAAARVFASCLTVLLAVACGAKADAIDQGDGVGGASGADAGTDSSLAPNASEAMAPLTCNQTSCEDRKCPALGDAGACPRLECGGELLCEGSGDRCILEALRDGKQGRLTWGTTSSYIHEFRITATIGSGRVGSGSWRESYDSPSTVASFTQLPLKPASFFEACLAADDPDGGTSDEVQDCLRHAFDVCP